MKKNYTTPKMVIKRLDCQRIMLPGSDSELPDDLYISTSFELEDEGTAD